MMTLKSGNSYDLNDPDLQNFITNTYFDREINSLNLIYSFLNDMNYNINYGNRTSDIILLKSCTLAINHCRVVCEGVCMTTRGMDCEAIHRAAQINMFSSHSIQTN